MLNRFFRKKEVKKQEIGDKNSSSITNVRHFPNAYSPSISVSFPGSSSQDRGFLSRSEKVSIEEISRQFAAGASIQELLIDYYPAEVCDALMDCYRQKKVSGMMITLLAQLLGSNRESKKIVNRAGFSQNDSDDDDEYEENDGVEIKNDVSVARLFEFDRLASRKDLVWAEYVTPRFLKEIDHVRSLLSAMIHVTHAEMILESSAYPPAHVFYDPVAKLVNGYTIQQLLLQGVQPAAIMFALEECYDRYPDSFAVILWRSLRLTLDHVGIDAKNDLSLIDEALLKLRDNPSTSIFECGLTLQELARYMNVSDEYKKLFVQQVVRSCMYICPFPENLKLQSELTAFQNNLHRSFDESTLVTNLADLLLLGISEKKIKTMYMNHQLYFLDKDKKKSHDDVIASAMKEEDFIHSPEQEANNKILSLLAQAFPKAQAILLDRVQSVVDEAKAKSFDTDEKVRDELCLVVVQSVRLGIYDKIIMMTNEWQITEIMMALLRGKLETVYNLSSDMTIAKQLSCMGITSIDDLNRLVSTLFNDIILGCRRKSQLKDQDFYRDLLFYVYDTQTDMSKKILCAGLSPADFILPSYQGDVYHDALCGYAESFVSRSHAENFRLNFSEFLSEFPVQQLYSVPVISRGDGFFAKQVVLIKLKNFLDSSTTFLTETLVYGFCCEMKMNIDPLMILLESYDGGSIRASRMLRLLQGIKGISARQKSSWLSNGARLIDVALLEFGGFDHFLRNQNSLIVGGFESEIVTICLKEFSNVFLVWLEHVKETLSTYYNNKNAFHYTYVLSETKTVRHLLKGFYEKIRQFSQDNREKPEWELIHFLLQAIFLPYAESVFYQLNVFNWQQLPTLNWQEYSKVIDYVAKLNDPVQFSSGLDCFVGYLDIYHICNPHVYALSAEKILPPILTAKDQERLNIFCSRECLYQQISLVTLPLLLLVKLIAQLTFENKFNELTWLDAQLNAVLLYNKIKLAVGENKLMALLVLQLFEYQEIKVNQDNVDIALNKLLESSLGKVLILLSDDSIVDYANYLSQSDQSNQDGARVNVILDQFFSLFEKFPFIQMVRTAPFYRDRLGKLLEIYPKLTLLRGFVDHVFEIGAHVLFTENDNHIMLVSGHASALEGVIASLLRAVPIAAKSELRAHYRLREVFDATYPMFDIKNPMRLRDYQCIYTTLLTISKMKENLSLAALYKYNNILNFLDSRVDVSDLDVFRKMDEMLFNHQKELSEDAKKTELLYKLYQILQTSLFLIPQEDALYAQLAIKFQENHLFNVLNRLDNLVADLAKKEIDLGLDYCDARVRWNNILRGLIELPVDSKLYASTRQIIRSDQHYNHQGKKDMDLYKGLGALFIEKKEDDCFEDYDRETSMLDRVSILFSNNEEGSELRKSGVSGLSASKTHSGA